MKIPISSVKKVREQLGATHLVAFLIMPDGEQFVITHGKTEVNAKECASLGNKMKRSLQWSPELCNAKPLQRICENCTYFREPAYRPGYGRVASGRCMWEPVQVEVQEKDKCHNFEPKV